MPAPLIGWPTTRPAVLASATVALALVVAAPVMATDAKET